MEDILTYSETTQEFLDFLKLDKAYHSDSLDLLEAQVVHAAQNDDYFRFRSSEGDYTVQPGRYRITIMATGKGAIGDEKSFIIGRDESGSLTFEREV